jgi:hypothetical protein
MSRVIRRRLASRLPWLADTVRTGSKLLAAWRRTVARSTAEASVPLRTFAVAGFRSCFGGYYDHAPFRPGAADLLLLHATDAAAWRRPDPRQPVSICLVERESGRLLEVAGQTYAWNWQQGARAMWLDDQRYVYNIYDESRADYAACMGWLGSERREIIPIPVQESDGRGKLYSLSYAALHRIRPDYGYRNRPASEDDVAGNSLQSYELATGRTRRHVSVASLAQGVFEESGERPVQGKLNHVLASPSGTRLVFLFRYLLRGRRVTDLHRFDADTGRQVRVLADAHVSHYCWLDDQTLLLTGAPEGRFGYYWLDVSSGDHRLVTLGSDGHPSRAGEQVVTDTYPDRRGFRRVLRLEEDGGECWQEVARFVDPVLLHGETRCDLHPVASDCGRWLKVDVAYGRRRCVAVCDLHGAGRDR